MNKLTFRCKNKDSEIAGIVICILLFLTGWLISSAIARVCGDSLFVTVAVPVAFLVCGVVYMSRRKSASSEEQTGTAEFAESGRVRLTFGGRSVIFDCKDIMNVSYTRDTLTNDAIGNSYIMTIRLPHRSYRIFSEELPAGVSGFENTGLYRLYTELAERVKSNGQP
jgi:hypothetical protein